MKKMLLMLLVTCSGVLHGADAQSSKTNAHDKAKKGEQIFAAVLLSSSRLLLSSAVITVIKKEWRGAPKINNNSKKEIENAVAEAQKDDFLCLFGGCRSTSGVLFSLDPVIHAANKPAIDLFLAEATEK